MSKILNHAIVFMQIPPIKGSLLIVKSSLTLEGGALFNFF